MTLAPTHVTQHPVNEKQLAQALLRQCEVCYKLAETRLKRQFPRPDINFKLTGKSAGTAHLQLNRLRFNGMLYQENSQIFLEEVVPHEIAHLLCFQIYGKVKPHGQEWQQIMWYVFGVEPKTTHNFDISSVKVKGFDYQCQCGTVELSIRRHNKIQRRQANYVCRQCHQVLVKI